MNRIGRNVEVLGKRTSFRLEAPFWRALEACARDHQTSTQDLIDMVVRQHGREATSMASALRVFLIDHFREQASRIEQGERVV
jgi:predicted DNA-binding ribbon-helix-helix protein